MSSQLALLMGYGLVLWLIRQDMKSREAGSWALLIPGIWLAMQASRPLSCWLNGGETANEADALDTAVFAVLMVASVVVVQRRGLGWGRLTSRNKALFVIYFYFLVGVMWSDMPELSLKRIIKDFGVVLVALVVLTEKRPLEAMRAMFVRVAYILFVMSVVTIKWVPAIGRNIRHSGDNMFRGVTTHKNTLGEVVFVFGLMLVWDLVETWNRKELPMRRRRIQILVGMLLTGVWLLVTCNSQTSKLCLFWGILIFWGTGRLLRMPNGKAVLVSCLAAAITVITADKTFGLSQALIKALGRNPNLTGRTEIWRAVREQNTDPLVGNGFYVFWDTNRGKAVVDEVGEIKSTHNGYLEVYVDGGLAADALLVVLLLVSGGRIINRLFMGDPLGRVGLAYWVTSIIFNFSESSFFRLDPLWFTLLLVSIECPRRSAQAASVTIGETRACLPTQRDAVTVRQA